MKRFLRLSRFRLSLLFLSLLLLCAAWLGAVQRAPLAAAPTQLEGEAAREFLAEQEMLAQVTADMNPAPPQGRTYSEIDRVTASDGTPGNNLGFSVALDGETVLVGAFGADINGNDGQGAVYVFALEDASWVEQQKLVANDGAADDFFGTSVTLAGETAIVGAFGADVDGNADQGAAYVFGLEGASWVQQQKLVASDGTANDNFGISVAVEGETALVGASLAEGNDNIDQGAAYIFGLEGASWVQQQRLMASDGAAGDLFGSSVALNGETALVGAYRAEVDGNGFQGAAYVFVRNGSNWVEQQKLTASDGAVNDSFGRSVALDDDTALVGASFAEVNGNGGQGAAYVFARNGSNWVQQQRLVAGDGAANDNFGISVALEGETALVGAFWADISGNSNQGAAYVFGREGASWMQQQRLMARDGAAGDSFGESVTLSGDLALAGAGGADVGVLSSNVGKAYIFERGPIPWPQRTQSTANDGAVGDHFGFSVALDGDTALVGASGAGAAYVFVRGGAGWVQQQKLVASDGAVVNAVALDDDTALVGASSAEVNGNDRQGAAYVFVREGTSWVEQHKLVASDGTENDYFGKSVALSGETALVGATGAGVVDNDSYGAAYVFVREGASWVQQQKLQVSNGLEAFNFGISVALSGETALVGASFGDNTSLERGTAYVFVREGTSWVQQQKLLARDGAVSGLFGKSVALDGETAIVGAFGADVDGNADQGAAYVFGLEGASWVQQQKLVASDGAAGDSFGRAVALAGETALVGAYSADVNGNMDQGKAYFFERERLAQTLDFPAPDGLATGLSIGTTALLSATTGSGLSVLFRSETPDICTVVGNAVTAVATGGCRVVAAQLGNTSYLAAPEVALSFEVLAPTPETPTPETPTPETPTPETPTPETPTPETPTPETTSFGEESIFLPLINR